MILVRKIKNLDSTIRQPAEALFLFCHFSFGKRKMAHCKKTPLGVFLVEVDYFLMIFSFFSFFTTGFPDRTGFSALALAVASFLAAAFSEIFLNLETFPTTSIYKFLIT